MVLTLGQQAGKVAQMSKANSMRQGFIEAFGQLALTACAFDLVCSRLRLGTAAGAETSAAVVLASSLGNSSSVTKLS